MKKYFLFAASALAIAGCSSDDFLGNDSSNGQNTANAVIKLGGSTTKTSRATSSPTTAYKTANLQDNGFWVYGTKHANDENATEANDQVVYKNYLLKYETGSANHTQSNTAGWEYVGVDNSKYFANIIPNITTTYSQTIKYWDYSAKSYTFYAATAKPKDVEEGKVKFEKILKDDGENGSVYNKGYNVTLKDGADLDQLYFADRKVITKKGEEHGADDVYGGEVNFKFRNALTKVRVAMYETVPGYSVTIDKFYYTTDAGNGQTTEAIDKFTADATNTPFATNNDKGVTYKVVYYNETEANGALENQPKMLPNKTGEEGSERSYLAIGDGNNLKANTRLNTEVNDPTFDTKGGSYTFFMPQAENNKTLNLKVDYTLTSLDNSGEEIHVKGATAIIPAEYLRWKPNYAYTYLFKISDNTNGSTGGSGDPAGLYPITFDASVVETANGNAEFISALGTSTITTFAVKNDKFQQGKADYEAESDLYATVVDDKKVTVELKPNNAKLYKLTDEALKFKEETSTIKLSEELVANWIANTKQDYYEEVKAGISYVNNVPTGDGKEVSLSPATATAMKVEGIDAGTYVIEYTADSPWTGAYKKIYKIVTIQQVQP